MASYTQNYQLHQWEPEDPFLRTDFNEDLAKIDAALGSVVQSSSRMVIGSYTGNAEDKTSLTQQIVLGFRPKAVLAWGILICPPTSHDSFYQALAIDHLGFSQILEITETGFSVGQLSASLNTNNPNLNNGDMTYQYAAWY